MGNIFTILIFLLLCVPSGAQLEIPDYILGQLTAEEVTAFENLSVAEREALEPIYQDFIDKIEGSAPKYEAEVKKRLLSLDYIKGGLSWTAAKVSRFFTAVDVFLQKQGIAKSYVNDMELAFFRHPKSFLSESSKGVFAQMGLSMAMGTLGKSAGFYFGFGVSVFKAKGGNLVIRFYRENLKLSKLYTPTIEISPVLAGGYESVRPDEYGEFPTEVEVRRDLLQGGVVAGTTDDVNQVGYNTAPAIPPVITFLTSSSFHGTRKTFASIEITNKMAKRIPFLRKAFAKLDQDSSVGSCRALL